MKQLRSLFFTMPAKCILTFLLIGIAFLVSECNVRYFSLFSEDKVSFINATMQRNSFDYENSFYYKLNVRRAIEDIAELAFEYEEFFDEETTDEELLEYFTSIGNTEFAEIYTNLSGIEELSFAVVNHSKDTIYSSVSEINGKKASTDIASYFSGSTKSTLIVRSCDNPNFATDSFIDFSEHIRSVAEGYEDSFDLYISFGSEESLARHEQECRQLHYNMLSHMKKLNRFIIFCCVLLVFITALMLTVTGKSEPKGKTSPTPVNRLPNDFIVLLYGIVLICELSLYRTTVSALLSHRNELEDFWFTHSNDFYTTRLRSCIIVITCVIVNLMCILKREYKMGKLKENTYIYSLIKSYRASKITKNDKNDEE